jgi:hypothetical protein
MSTLAQPERDLAVLLSNMKPRLESGAFLFLPFPNGTPVPTLSVLPTAVMQEREGTTLVIRTTEADADKIKYDPSSTFARITLDVHSALDAVGLTAAVSTALAKEGISCNVIAAYWHDHLYVSYKRREDAVRILERVSEEAKAER